MRVASIFAGMNRVNRQVMFDHDRLDAYNLARAFRRTVEALMKRLPRGHAEEILQLRSAALSVSLNTAEGAGEFKPAEKARFYRIARRSGTESAAVLDSFVDRDAFEEADIEPARVLLHRAVGALTRLIQSCDPDWTNARARSTAAPAPTSARKSSSKSNPGQ